MILFNPFSNERIVPSRTVNSEITLCLSPVLKTGRVQTNKFGFSNDNLFRKMFKS